MRDAIPIRLSPTFEAAGAPAAGPAPAEPPYVRAPSRVMMADAWLKRSDIGPAQGDPSEAEAMR
jgi:hypothetical protein